MTSIDFKIAASNLERVQKLADRAAARVFGGQVQSPAYALKLARELEEAQATYDLVRYRASR